MKHLYFTCGISGVGKSYWCSTNSSDNDVILDSDIIRAELWGDASDQRRPDIVFNQMFSRAKEKLTEGHNVYYCATGLSMKHRINFIKQIRKLFPRNELLLHCVVLIAPFSICLSRSFNRTRKVPADIIRRQLRQFQMPVMNEGWDSITVVPTYEYDVKEYKERKWQEVIDFGSQENKHHTNSLINHCMRCGLDMAVEMPDNKDLRIAASIHDFGKLYTKEYWPEKDTDAHYPNHAEVGAMLALLMGYSPRVAQLVGYHMCPYMDKAAQNTWHHRLGDSLWNDVLLIHNCDVRAH